MKKAKQQRRRRRRRRKTATQNEIHSIRNTARQKERDIQTVEQTEDDSDRDRRTY